MVTARGWLPLLLLLLGATAGLGEGHPLLFLSRCCPRPGGHGQCHGWARRGQAPHPPLQEKMRGAAGSACCQPSHGAARQGAEPSGPYPLRSGGFCRETCLQALRICFPRLYKNFALKCSGQTPGDKNREGQCLTGTCPKTPSCAGQLWAQLLSLSPSSSPRVLFSPM